MSAVGAVTGGITGGPVSDLLKSSVATADNTLTHIILYGQSLALGSDSGGGSVITSSASSSHKMFTTGVRVHYDTSGVSNQNTPVNPDSMATIVDLEEQINPNDSNMAETFAAGIGLWLDDDSLMSCTARGAYKAEQLNRTGNGVLADFNHFQNTYATALHAYEYAQDNEYAYSLGPMVFKQGEADSSNSKATWKTEVQQLRDDFASHLMWACKQDTADWLMIIDQQGMSRSGFTYADLAVGAIELHRAGNGIVCAGPNYPEEFTAINDVHMASNGYRNYGERLGRIIQTIIDTGTWNPCYITSVSRSTTTITVNVHVPEPPLQINTTDVASVTDSGFAYSGASITGVSITDTGVGDNAGVIEITIDADAGGTLHYAYNNPDLDFRIGPTYGPRGNICDSDSAVTKNDGMKLYNWLCVDEWAVA